MTSPGWVSLTEAKAPAGIVLWIMEAYQPPHHVKEWTMKGKETALQ